MRYICFIGFLVLFFSCSGVNSDVKPQAPQPKSSSALSLSEKTMQQAYGNAIEYFQLWEGDGTRQDDPKVDEGETIKDYKARYVTQPSFAWMPTKKKSDKAVLVFPGGGYKLLSMDQEGFKVGQWLNALGFHAFILKYRVPRREGLDKSHVAFQDAMRAIRMIKYHHALFGIDAKRLGVMGFSAGGHLAALTWHHHDQSPYTATDEADKINAKPAFLGLIYPAYLKLKSKATLSTEFHNIQDKDTPICAIIARSDKNFVPGFQLYTEHLSKMQANITSKIFEEGRHGIGLVDTPWDSFFADWLNRQ